MFAFLWFLLIGLAAGWLARRILKEGGNSLIMDMVIGVIGSILGGGIIHLLGFSEHGLLASLVVATMGAVLLLLGLRKIGR